MLPTPRALTWCLVVSFFVAGVAAAQRGAAPPFEGPRGYVTVDLTDGEPISAFIEAARPLALSAPQLRRLMDIRRVLRGQNKPYMERLDSLRALAGLDLGARERIGRKDEEALQRFNTWARPSIDSIRMNNEVARAEARSLLLPEQRARMDSLLQASRAREGRPRQRPRG
jgi:hypothetical protein